MRLFSQLMRINTLCEKISLHVQRRNDLARFNSFLEQCLHRQATFDPKCRHAIIAFCLCFGDSALRIMKEGQWTAVCHLADVTETKHRKNTFLAFGLRGKGPWPCIINDSYLVDPASSHMLVSKIQPCMSKYKLIYTVKLRMAH